MTTALIVLVLLGVLGARIAEPYRKSDYERHATRTKS